MHVTIVRSTNSRLTCNKKYSTQASQRAVESSLTSKTARSRFWRGIKTIDAAPELYADVKLHVLLVVFTCFGSRVSLFGTLSSSEHILEAVGTQTLRGCASAVPSSTRGCAKSPAAADRGSRRLNAAPSGADHPCKHQLPRKLGGAAQASENYVPAARTTFIPGFIALIGLAHQSRSAPRLHATWPPATSLKPVLGHPQGWGDAYRNLPSSQSNRGRILTAR